MTSKPMLKALFFILLIAPALSHAGKNLCSAELGRSPLFSDWLIYQTDSLIPTVFRSELENAQSILEVGTGTGRQLIQLAKLSHSKIAALDIDENNLKLARTHLDILSNMRPAVDHLRNSEIMGLMAAIEALGAHYVNYVPRKHLTDFYEQQYLKDPSTEPPSIQRLRPDDARFDKVFRSVLRDFQFQPPLRFDNIVLARGDARSLAFVDNSSDIVVLNELLLYFDPETLKQVLLEAKRVTASRLFVTNYTHKSLAMSGQTAFGNLADNYWRLALELYSLGVSTIEIVGKSTDDLGRMYRRFQLTSKANGIDRGYFFRKAMMLKEPTQRDHLIRKYFLAPEGRFYMHDPETILGILEGGSYKTYSGGAMFSAQRDLIEYKKM